MNNDLAHHPHLESLCYKTILDKIDDGILVSDENGQIILYNRAAEDIEGLSRKDIIGKRLDDIYISNREEGSEHKHVLESGLPILNQYRSFALNNRMGHYINYNTYPVVDSGKVVAVCTISKNERRLQEALIETIDLKRKLASRHSKESQISHINNGTNYTFTDLIGTSARTEQVIREAQNMAMVDSHLLIVGETGTGKEVFAQSIHNYSKNGTAPFVAINCSAIPENLLESILFGTQRGAFTGAVDTPGLFEDAGNGTLFLDELNSMPLTMQSKLLRVLQERKANRVGASKLYPVNCRIISALNETPKTLITNGLLRKDLYYRLSALILQLPPLRIRPEDIKELSMHFIRKYNRLLEKQITGMDSELHSIFNAYEWPGNVRELEYVIENLMIRTHGKDVLSLSDMPDFMKLDMSTLKLPLSDSKSLNHQLDALEYQLITSALREAHGNIPKAANQLCLTRQSLHGKIKRLHIDITHFKNNFR